MGHSSYDFQARTVRATSLNYASTHANDTRVFRQNALKKVNEGMDPAQISLREARDSEIHPCTVPIVLQLDETGSMGRIPAKLVAGELPKLMGELINGGCPDAALLFIAVGDQYSDSAPLQIGQFESGDAELDHWLTSCYLEQNGGANDGESYSLGWLFAMNMIQTDAWDKRKEKGLFISIGDEPLHASMDVNGLKKIFGRQFDKVVEGIEYGGSISAKQVFQKIRERWNVHHIQLGATGDSFHRDSWKMLGEGYHEIGRDDSPVTLVKKIVFDHMGSHGCNVDHGSSDPVDSGSSDPSDTGSDTVSEGSGTPSIPEPL